MLSWKKSSECRDEVDFFDLDASETKLLGAGYIKALNYQDHDCTQHYYRLLRGNESDAYHIHWYKRLVTGTSLLKEYDFTELYSVARLNGVSDKSLFSYLVLIRFFIKFNLLFGVVRYYRDRKLLKNDFVEALEVLKKDKDGCKYVESNCSMPVDMLESYFDSNVFRQYLFSIVCKHKTRKFRRLSFSRFLFLYPSTFLKSMIFKAFGLRKRLHKPFYMAIVGTDGSGKSTVVSGIIERLRGFSPMLLHYGLPNSTPLDRLKNRYLVAAPRSNDIGSNLDTTKNSNRLSFVKRMYYLDLAIRRLRTACYGKFLSYIGRPVVFDRYHNISVESRIDGRNIPSYYAINSNIERFFYWLTPTINQCYFLKPPLECVIRRNDQRVKSGKESVEEIKNRYLSVDRLRIKSKIVTSFDNTGSVEEAVDFIMTGVIGAEV